MKQIKEMDKALFEMCFELEDIEDVQETGYKNMYDINVSGEHTFILENGIVSHNSALGGLSPVLGRKDCGYYILKGKPLNAYKAPQAKFTANKELSQLYKVIQNENYEYIIYGTDQDLDGFHIRGLLTGFFVRYLPELKNRIGILQTPVIGITKNDKIIKWYYDLNDSVKLKPGEVTNWMKGLGSWDIKDLKRVIEVDGLDKMITMLEFDKDADRVIEEWLGDDSEPRKKYILANDFSITKT